MGDCMVHKAIEPKNLSKALQESQAEHDWVISPKYDGCHAIFCFDDGALVGVYSRQGETVRSMVPIGEALLTAYDLRHGRIAICGEAWVVGTEFKEISGMFRRHAPQPQLCFVPFDCVPFDYREDTTGGPPIDLGVFNSKPYPAPYIKRIEGLLDWVGAPAFPCLIKPTFTVVNGCTIHTAFEHAKVTAKHYKASEFAHYDGAIMARADGKYIVGAGKGGEFVKVKPLQSESVVVTGLFPDKGEKTGKTTLALGFTFNGVAQKVSTGLSQAEVDSFVDNPALILDKTIEVEFMGIYPTGGLREPRYKGIRTDV